MSKQEHIKNLKELASNLSKDLDGLLLSHYQKDVLRGQIESITYAITLMENEEHSKKNICRQRGSDFTPDWCQLEAAQSSLREHMKLGKEYKLKMDRMVDAVEKYKNQDWSLNLLDAGKFDAAKEILTKLNAIRND